MFEKFFGVKKCKKAPLEGIDAEIAQVSADGAYDHRHCYDEIAQHDAKAVIPPCKDAKIWEHGNTNAPPHPRDQNLRYIRKHGRKKWKRDSGYHRRSLAETTMFRFKKTFGGTLCSRKFDNQAVELFIKCAALNRMIQLAKPLSCYSLIIYPKAPISFVFFLFMQQSHS